MDGGRAARRRRHEPSRLNDINPEEIENIEIVKGPSAATLYGTDAANGVIVITTKKGRPGNTRWTWTAEQGTVQDKNKYPHTWAEWGHLDDGREHGADRALHQRHAGDGQLHHGQPSRRSYQIRDPKYSPIGTASAACTARRSAAAATPFASSSSGDLENEFGPISMPGIRRALPGFDEGRRPRRVEASRKRCSARTFRANLSGSLSPKLDMLGAVGVHQDATSGCRRSTTTSTASTTTRYTNQGHRLHRERHERPELQRRQRASASRCTGGRSSRRRTSSSARRSRAVQRFIGSSTGELASVDVDAERRHGRRRFRRPTTRSVCSASTKVRTSARSALGAITDRRDVTRNFTATVRSTATWNRERVGEPPHHGRRRLRATTRREFSNANSTQLAPGGADGRFRRGQGRVEPVADRDQDARATTRRSRSRFATGSSSRPPFRYDQNSAFGTKFKGVAYPKFSASYNISDESFFPHNDYLNSLHLRLAYGASGVQPGATSALRTFSTTTDEHRQST